MPEDNQRIILQNQPCVLNGNLGKPHPVENDSKQTHGKTQRPSCVQGLQQKILCVP